MRGIRLALSHIKYAIFRDKTIPFQGLELSAYQTSSKTVLRLKCVEVTDAVRVIVVYVILLAFALD